MGERNNDSESGTEFPDVGTDMAPSNEMIVEGKVGNGTHDRFTPELQKQIQLERKKNAEVVKQSEREGYLAGIRDSYAKVGELERGILDIGLQVMKAREEGEPLTKRELDSLKLAQDTAKEMKDREGGKSTSRHEVKQETTILALLRQERIDG